MNELSGELMKKSKRVTPILRWVGGKRQLIDEIQKYIPSINWILDLQE